jgi:hypothetical protein
VKTTACAMATTLALGLALPVFAGETVTEHDSYEKRSMKVETIPPPAVTERRTEETTETSRTDSPPRNPPTIVEKRTTIVPGGTVTERKTEKTETDTDD